MKLSLKNKFLFPTITLLILGLGTSMLISYMNARKALDTSIKAQITETAATVNENLTSWIERSQLDLSIWSEMKVYQTAVQNSFAGRAAQKAASEELATLRDKYKLYESLSVVDSNGNVVASSTPDLIGTMNIADQQTIQSALKGEISLSEVFPSRNTNNPVCIITALIKEQDTITGGLFGVIDITYLSHLYIDPIKVGQTGYAYLLDVHGIVIAYPDQTQVLTLNSQEYGFGRKMLEQQEGIITYDWERQKKIAAFQRSQVTGWTMVVAANFQEIFAPIQTMRTINFVVAGSVILLTVIIILLLVQMIIKPITTSAEFAKLIAAGDLSGTIDIRQQDEVGRLVDVLREMVAKLRDMVMNVQRAASNVTDSSQTLSNSCYALRQN